MLGPAASGGPNGPAHAHYRPVLTQAKPSPLCNSPPELLTYIFTLLAHGEFERHWISFSQVCEHWRAVALSSPVLWTRPGLWRLRQFNHLLARSRGLPLDLFIDVDDDGAWRVLRRALMHWSRIRTLELSSTAAVGIVSTWEGKFHTGEPLILEVLRVTKRGKQHVPPYTLDPQLFAMIPALRSLELDNCAPPWKSFSSAPRLAELKLQNIPGMTWPQIFDALQATQSLVTLEVALTFPTWDSASPHISSISLPSLLQLKVIGSPDTCCALMQRLSFPTDCFVQLDSTRVRFVSRAYAMLRLALQAFMAPRGRRERQDGRLTSLTMDYGGSRDNGSFVLSLAFSTAPDMRPLLTLAVDVMVELTDLYAFEDGSDWLELASPETVIITGRFGHVYDVFPDPFKNLFAPGAHTLVLRGQDAFSGFLSLICLPGRGAPTLAQSFPALRRLVVHSAALADACLRWEATHAHVQEMQDAPHYATLLRVLLGQYAQHKGRLEELCFERCIGYDTLGAQFGARLRETVGVVEGWGEDVTRGYRLTTGESFSLGRDCHERSWEDDFAAVGAVVL